MVILRSIKSSHYRVFSANEVKQVTIFLNGNLRLELASKVLPAVSYVVKLLFLAACLPACQRATQGGAYFFVVKSRRRQKFRCNSKWIFARLLFAVKPFLIVETMTLQGACSNHRLSVRTTVMAKLVLPSSVPGLLLWPTVLVNSQLRVPTTLRLLLFLHLLYHSEILTQVLFLSNAPKGVLIQ